jgi:hypothetical protein
MWDHGHYGNRHHNSTMAVPHQQTLADYPDFQYWDAVKITKYGLLHYGCTGHFLSVRMMNFTDEKGEKKTEPRALIELHPSPDEGSNIKVFSFTEFRES